MALVIVSGALANKPFNGGNAWSRLSWIQGFQRLGFEVCFVEQLSRDTCLDASGQPCPLHSSVNLAYFEQTMEHFGLKDAGALIYREGEEIHGLTLSEVSNKAAGACLLFNLSGHLSMPDLKGKIACKVYYDDDPGYTQFWQAMQSSGPRLWDHDFYFTLGENIGRPDCAIPTNGINWRPTRPPVVLDQWPVAGPTRPDRFTTVASWRGAYGPIQYHGVTYGLKVHEFRKFMDLPQRSGRNFEIALQIHPADQKDLNSLVEHGWHVTDPKTAAGSPDDFRRFVQNSGAEFSVAQGVYVGTNSGWFSDRTVRYLASGKPVLVQDTGFSKNYPVGNGLLAFKTMDEAVDGVEQIERDYEKHCRAARKIAEEYFDSGRVITRLIKEIGVALP